MAKFLLGQSDVTEFSINRKTVQFSIDFTLPDGVRENMAADDVRLIDGVFCMSFYSDPHVGDTVEYRGFLWRITGRHFLINRYTRKGEPRSIPKLLVEFVGSTEEC